MDSQDALVRATGLLTATTLALAALTACGTDSEPDPTTSTASPIDKGTDEPSPSSSTTDSGSPDGPDVPPGAKENTKKGAIAFTKLWFETAGAAIEGGDIAWVEDHTDKDCAACWSLIESIKSDQSKGLQADGDPIAVEEPSARKRPDGGYRVEFSTTYLAHDVVNSDGQVVESVKKDSATTVTNTHWTDDGWVLKGWIIK